MRAIICLFATMLLAGVGCSQTDEGADRATPPEDRAGETTAPMTPGQTDPGMTQPQDPGTMTDPGTTTTDPTMPQDQQMDESMPPSEPPPN